MRVLIRVPGTLLGKTFRFGSALPIYHIEYEWDTLFAKIPAEKMLLSSCFACWVMSTLYHIPSQFCDFEHEIAQELSEGPF